MSKFGRAATATGSPNRSPSNTSSAACAECSAWVLKTLRKSRWMAALSSMIRMRRLASGTELAMGGLDKAAGQFEDECRAETGPVAGHAQRAAEFLGGERPAVLADAVAVHASREAGREQAENMFLVERH